MGRTTMDEFNERKMSKVKENTSVTWEEGEERGEAVCAVCDALFTPTGDRPPIFCAPCKAALKHNINR